jgi:hypothetical protein
MWCRDNECCVSCIIKWMCACIVHYNVMFTCTLLRSYPESIKMLGETWATAIKAINSILWTSVASRCSLTILGAGPGSVCGQKGTMKDVFARCLKRADVQVCTLTFVYLLFRSSNIHALLHSYLSFMINNYRPLHVLVFCDCIITSVYFSQVKNKPWIPWVYTWFWHRREQELILPENVEFHGLTCLLVYWTI